MIDGKRISHANFLKAPADIIVLAFSLNNKRDFYDLISRCLNSIIENTNPDLYRLHIGCNNLSRRVTAYVDELVERFGAKKYIGKPFHDSKGNTVYPKYPVMRKIYESTQGDWVIWFDDDIFVEKRDWLEKLEQTINLNPRADQFGIPLGIILPPSVKAEWIDSASWSRPGKIQYMETHEGKKITTQFIWGGFYALSRTAIERCDIPDRRLFHNFGDWTTGMALFHNGFNISKFNYGIVSGKELRRGIHNDIMISANDKVIGREIDRNGCRGFCWDTVPSPDNKDSKNEQSMNLLPGAFTRANLERNLSALNRVNPALLRRICLPVESEPIHFSSDGRALYRRHLHDLPFDLEEGDLNINASDKGQAGSIFLFGIGLGEQLDYLLRQYSDSKITVWDRDPWLIRLALMKGDYHNPILSGRLHMTMCSDLLDCLETVPRSWIIAHPILHRIYEYEYRLLNEEIEDKRALICSGGLYVDDAVEQLRKMGYSLYTLDIKKLSFVEIELTIRRFRPQFIFAINYTNGLAELCHRYDTRLICWEIDPAADRLKSCQTDSSQSYIFTYRRRNTEEFGSAGFQHVEYLPLAVDPEKRAVPELTPPENTLYYTPLSFVGSSMMKQAERFRKLFLRYYRDYTVGNENALEKGRHLLEQILAQQREDFSRYRIPELLKAAFGKFLDFIAQQPEAYDPYMLVGEIAAAEKRRHYLTRIGHLGLKVWGDEGWQNLESRGLVYMGKAGHHYEINKIYAASVINLDINRLYQGDIVTMRIFDVMSCGGFVLTEHSKEVEELFEIGKDIVVYRTLDELLEKGSYYLEHREKAEEIAKRGRDLVLRDHTISRRMRYMLDIMQKSHAHR